MIRKASWGLMTFLAIGVGGYALAMSLMPELRQDFVANMFRDHTLSAWAHLMGGGIALITGAFQFSKKLRSSKPAVHRWMGRLYVLCCLASGLSALHMALTTPGGLAAQFGFALLAIAWLMSTAMAVIRIRQRNVLLHQQWMVRSYALTLAAVSLRIYLPLALGNGMPFESVYPAIAWLCWVPNLVIAEWFIMPLFMARKPG